MLDDEVSMFGRTKEEILGYKDSIMAVSYTHLDVYKRQVKGKGPKGWNQESALGRHDQGGYRADR